MYRVRGRQSRKDRRCERTKRRRPAHAQRRRASRSFRPWLFRSLDRAFAGRSESEANLARDRALPKGSFDADNFDNERTSFQLRGTSIFADRGYRGELRVLLINLGDADYTISSGDRIAQLVVAPVTRVAVDESVTVVPPPWNADDPPVGLEFLFTTCEEVALQGAKAFDRGLGLVANA